MFHVLPGDKPLADDVRNRLRRVRATLACKMDPDIIIPYLFTGMVINNAEHQFILALTTVEQKNMKILEILMRGSEGKLQCFKDILLLPSIDMAYAVKIMEKG